MGSQRVRHDRTTQHASRISLKKPWTWQEIGRSMAVQGKDCRLSVWVQPTPPEPSPLINTPPSRNHPGKDRSKPQGELCSFGQTLVKPEIKLPTSIGSSKKHESSRKTSTSALLTVPKPLPVWITANYGKFLKGWEYQTTWPASWEIYMQVKKQQLELDMEQQTGSKSGKEYIKAVYCHAAYLTYMQSTSC